MVWVCFLSYHTGPIYKIEGIMDQFDSLNTLKNNRMPYAEEEMPLK